jgi:hypothetical protein
MKVSKIKKDIIYLVIFLWSLYYVYYEWGAKGTSLGRTGSIVFLILIILDYFFGIRKYIILNKRRHANRNIQLSYNSADKNNVYINLPRASKRKMHLKVTNTMGNEVMVEHYNMGAKKSWLEQLSLNVPGLKSGFYFISLSLEDKNDTIYKTTLTL